MGTKTSSLTATRCLDVKEAAAFLNLPDLKSLFMLRAACRRGAIPCTFPALVSGSILESELHAFKKKLDAIVAQAGNNQPTSPSPLGRRANTDRRQR